MVAGHPVGAQAEVFYNPQNPQDAVLSAGVDGSDLILVLFVMPFNMVMFGFWTWLSGWLRERIFRPVAGGVRIITEGPRTNIRLPEYGANSAVRSQSAADRRCTRQPDTLVGRTQVMGFYGQRRIQL